VCKSQNKDGETELARLRSELESLRSLLVRKQMELGKMETSISQLTNELITSRAELSKAIEKTAKNDAKILDLNQQMALFQHEVGFYTVFAVWALAVVCPVCCSFCGGFTARCYTQSAVMSWQVVHSLICQSVCL